MVISRISRLVIEVQVPNWNSCTSCGHSQPQNKDPTWSRPEKIGHQDGFTNMLPKQISTWPIAFGMNHSLFSPRHCGLKPLAKAAVQDETPRSVASVTYWTRHITWTRYDVMYWHMSRSDFLNLLFYKTRHSQDTSRVSKQRLVCFCVVK